MRYSFLFLILLTWLGVAAQTENPINYGSATHPFKIYSIQHNDKYTIVDIELTNQIDKGYFCADRKIYINNVALGYETMLVRSEGIPTCPDVYQFHKAGETLRFKLFFDKIPAKVTTFDIIETCNENCFSINGVVNNVKMNAKINSSYVSFAKNDLEGAIRLARELVEEYPDYEYGFLYFNLIHFTAVKGDYEKAKQAYNAFKEKQFFDKRNTVSRLQAMEYYMKLI